MLDDLIAGYADVGDAPRDLRGSATLIVATQLCRWIERDGVESLDRPSGRWWLARLAALLRGRNLRRACMMVVCPRRCSRSRRHVAG